MVAKGIRKKEERKWHKKIEAQKVTRSQEPQSD
jgi:hypothetical protein